MLDRVVSNSVFAVDPAHFASDGSPIGEVKDASPVDVLAEEARHRHEVEAAYDVAVDSGLFADPKDVDLALVDAIYPKYNDRVARRKALELYAKGEAKFDEIAEKLGIPLRTLAQWAKVGNWSRLQESTAATLGNVESARLRINRSLRRESILNEQLDLAKKVRDKAKAAIDRAESSGQLKLAAEAAKLAADLEVRALGIGDSGAVSDGRAAAPGQADARTPLVINFQGGLPPVRVSGPGEAIDVP